MTAQASLAGMPGRERVDVLIYEAAKSVPPVPPAPEGARSASIKAWPLARYQERGEPCEVCSCLTGCTHHISLKRHPEVISSWRKRRSRRVPSAPGRLIR